MGFFNEVAHLFVNGRRDIVGVFQLSAASPPGERVALFLTVFYGSEVGAHTVLGHHGAGDFRGLLDIRGGPRRRVTENELFTGPTAHSED